MCGVVCSLLGDVCCSLFVVRVRCLCVACCPFVVCCLFVACRLLFAVRCQLLVVWCMALQVNC